MQGYLPGEYECLSSSYGSEADLRRCIRALHANGIRAIADVVLNHRCAGKQVCFSPAPQKTGWPVPWPWPHAQVLFWYEAHPQTELWDFRVPMTCTGTLQDSQGRWNQYTGRYAWDPSCICSGDEQFAGTGQPKEGSCFGAAPNVDHSSERVRKVVPARTSGLPP